MRRFALPLSLAALLLAGCGDVSREAEDAATTTAATAAEATTTTSADPTLSVAPADGLASGDAVTVEGDGFPAGVGLFAVQCAADSTEPADCDLLAARPAEVDADGRLTTEFVLNAGPFGQSGVVCDASNPCVLAVSRSSTDPRVPLAVAPLAFG